MRKKLSILFLLFFLGTPAFTHADCNSSLRACRLKLPFGITTGGPGNPSCQQQLNACNSVVNAQTTISNLITQNGTLQQSLTTCQSNYNTVYADDTATHTALDTCNTNLATVNSNLIVCQNSLTQCQAQCPVPGASMTWTLIASPNAPITNQSTEVQKQKSDGSWATINYTSSGAQTYTDPTGQIGSCYRVLAYVATNSSLGKSAPSNVACKTGTAVINLGPVQNLKPK